ncbi:MAG: 4-hydroxy-tetrahydrodipicolinate reductase, partial [Actinobacteria bacterium]|nr:4-hydroxy-tetrahydrodipicolinate reductase [Actinomycetota bacterium]
MIRVGVVGAAGKMGEEVCRAINADPGTELVAQIDL